jgi:aspartyl-tRNA(Asn)/glutamyl-tRNA(Gln) amidotransferase subunit C
MIKSEDLDRIAALAKLEIKDSEKTEYIEEIENLLGHIEKIMIADEENNEVSYQFKDFSELREDEVKPSTDRDKLLSNADDTQDGFVKLKRRV